MGAFVFELMHYVLFRRKRWEWIACADGFLLDGQEFCFVEIVNTICPLYKICKFIDTIELNLICNAGK